MSVEREALNAAIDYGQKLEQENFKLREQVGDLMAERRALQIQLNRVRDAARDRMAVPCEAMTATEHVVFKDNKIVGGVGDGIRLG